MCARDALQKQSLHSTETTAKWNSGETVNKQITDIKIYSVSNYGIASQTNKRKKKQQQQQQENERKKS